MPALSNCRNCGKACWNLEPSDSAKFMCATWLIDGKFCPHCGKDAGFSVSDEVFKRHQKEKAEGKWDPGGRLSDPSK